jgi:F-type H+-transporting ATPase subunit gamma
MPSPKEIRTKIASVKNTQKITKAMEMVAASKMRKAQNRMRSARPYAEKMRAVIQHLANAKTEYRHPYMVKDRTVKRIGVIVISTDRGLCGGLNASVFRTCIHQFRAFKEAGVEFDICAIGNKGVGFFSRAGGSLVASRTHLGDNPHVVDFIGTVKVMLDSFDAGRIDKLYVVYNEFINSMSQKPRFEQLLPVEVDEGHAAHKELKHVWDYIYEPDAKEVMDPLLQRYVESMVYQAVVENFACEQAARMVAMKSAADNAGKLISELQLIYNKARQAAITKELSEIVGGAAAV